MRISIREWNAVLENNLKLFGSVYKDENPILVEYGWYDYFSEDHEIKHITEQIYSISSKITNNILLDNYRISIKECNWYAGYYYTVRLFPIKQASDIKALYFTIGQKPRTGKNYTVGSLEDELIEFTCDSDEALLDFINNFHDWA